MPKLPLLNAQEMGRILVRLGFELKRQQGSHRIYEHPDGRTTVIPSHAGEDLKKGLLNKIIKRDLQMSKEEFIRQAGLRIREEAPPYGMAEAM